MLDARKGKVFTDFWTPAKFIESMNITNVVSRIEVPTLLYDYEYEQFYPGQTRQMFDKLTGASRFLAKFDATTGGQLHCSPMAPQQHCDLVFDWLQDELSGN
ncbi:hypothetical protein [Streptomyces sp. NPDC056527]|uniref:hypothetical protein n=1 Tax=Streptomyces sp. NPDC056527 TaxID=3345853 RepID=UPI00368D1379